MPLDCVSQHRVYIYDRGGKVRVGELVNLNRVKWGRVRDDISESEVDITSSYCQGQEDMLAQIEPGRHEFVVFRGDDRVWEGPITRAVYTRNGVQFFARDVMHYAYRTVMHAGYSSAYPNIEFVTNRAERIMRAEMARKEALNPPINVLPYLVNHHTATDAQTARVTKPYEMTVFEHVDDMAAKGGLDYTVVGRAVHLWDVDQALGWAAQVTDSDFLGDVVVTSYGMELATIAISTDGEGTAGIAGAIDPYYGEVETLFTAYDESEDDGPPPTQAELQSQAERNLAGRNPTPIQVRIPENSSLNPAGVLNVTDLIPGTHLPLVATLSARTISQVQKIHVVDFEETADGEAITITLVPAAQNDDGA